MVEIVVAIFVEGDTEVEFYKKLIAYLRAQNGNRLNCKVVVKNAKGIGNFKDKVNRIFEKDIKVKQPNCIYKVVLCYDSDVFEYSSKPPVIWPEVIKALEEKGAGEVLTIKAVKSIEDWFLMDKEGLRKFLNLPKSFQMASFTGQKGLEQLFRKARRLYIKGRRCEGLVDALDMREIIPNIDTEIRNLKLVLGIR